MEFMDSLREFVGNYWLYIAGGTAAVLPLLRGAVGAYLRRPKSVTRLDSHLSEQTLLSPPLARPAYSDRMAYVLAEMSDLAYFEFERRSHLVDEATEEALASRLGNQVQIREFLESFSATLMSERRFSESLLRRILRNSGFELLTVINVDETQGFICKRKVLGEPPYVVLAFRGTEKKVSDWLTDADCVPEDHEGGKVHRGFLKAFIGLPRAPRAGDNAGGEEAVGEGARKAVGKKTVKEIVEDALAAAQADRENDGSPLPVFVTGHSLGGALALLTTRILLPDVTGACYTFGAPRVGDYEFFRRIKTPVYRIVNSSDVVPRVPPGAGMMLLRGIVKALSWWVGSLPVISGWLVKLEALFDKLRGYRHYGDLRYLSDVAEGQFQDVRLLSNPPAADRIVWMWRRVAKSLFVPIKSHNMRIYREKLRHVALDRS